MTKERDFKRRFVEVMENLQSTGAKDPQAMWLVGRLATVFVDEARQNTWSQLKAVLSAEGYDNLLKVFQTQGNALVEQGKGKEAYAVQVLALSLVAKTQQKDPDLVSGSRLLDQLIDAAVAFHRANPPPSPAV